MFLIEEKVFFIPRHFVFKLNQSLEIVLKSSNYIDEKFF